MESMTIETNMGSLKLINDRQYSFDSADNIRDYPNSYYLSKELYNPSSLHGVLLNEKPLAIFGDCAGASGIHEHSIIAISTKAFLAVGQHVVCFSISPFVFHWAIEIDQATCFGIYRIKETDSFISHGELDISKFTSDGIIAWQKSGADIFSGDIKLYENYVEVYDFNGDLYRFDYDGKSESRINAREKSTP